ncbi:MAG TPA: transketolase C-terminal domain-containing protein, partial [Thermodesulfobacteriota bacterium]|nr:transketolase C-terminal domain-containing protein [Thermodesulfobacteriota bacterium]
WKTGGVGGELASIIMERCFDCLDAPVKRVAGADVPTPYSKNLEKLALPQVENIIASVRELG